MAMERKRLEIARSGFDEPWSVRGLAAPGRAQILPPLPRTPEFLTKKIPPSTNTRPQDSPVAGPSSRPLDEPASIVPKESLSARPSPPPAFTPPSTPRPSEGPKATPAPPRISCEGWNVSELCRKYPNFHEVRRVKASTVHEDLSRIMDEYENAGNPLIIEGWDEHPDWRPDLLNMDWLLADVKDKELHVRNVHDRKDYSTDLPAFVDMCRKLPVYHEPGEPYRVYWKDAECPSQWKEWLGKILPPELLPGCSGDFLRHLYPSEAVESLMCYLGIGDTYTAAHKDICSSSGHNLMCFSENGGSSFWFMTESQAAPKAAEYFQKVLGEELDWETHVTTLEELGNAPFDVYVAEQKVGDLVLVPPRSVHQVVNQGGLAMKTSWSRMTLQGLKTALHSELPVYRRVCRPEQYRIKTILYRTILHHSDSLRSSLASKSTDDTNGSLVGIDTLNIEYTSSESGRDSEPLSTPPPRPSVEQRADTLRSLVELFDEVLLEEYAPCHNWLPHVLGSDKSGWSVTTETSMRRKLVLVPPSDARDRTEKQRAGACNFACDFCGADIFQSFFECRACSGSSGQSTQAGDGLLVCPACYVEGRSCECDRMKPVQCRPLRVLIADRNRAAEVLRQIAPTSNVKAPLDLQESDLREHKDIRVFEAACVYRELKLKSHGEERHCRATDKHLAPPSAGLPCAKCKYWKCFLHHLRQGTHVAEAVLALAKSEEDFHKAHKDNTLKAKNSSVKLYNVHGSKIKTRLMIAARSFPRCKPWHAKTRAGFYDTEFEAEPELDDELSPSSPTPSGSGLNGTSRHTPTRLDLSAPFLQPLDAGETSPLTSLDSDSPERLVTATHCPEEPAHLLGDPEQLIISVGSSDVPVDVFGDPVNSSQHRSPSVSPTATAVDAGSEVEVSEIVIQSGLPRSRQARQNKAYVEISRPQHPKRTASLSSDEPEWVDEPPPKKSRSTHQRASENRQGTARGRSESRTEAEAMRPSANRKSKARSASEDDFVGASYGEDLASALSRAVAAKTPIFTQPGAERSSGPLLRRPTAVRRIMSPDSDRGASPTRSEPSNSAPQPPPAPIASSSTRPLPRNALKHKQTTFRPGKLPTASASADIEASRPPKRKRGKPPGIPHDQINRRAVSRHQEERSPRKKARVAQRPDPEVIEIDDEPIPINPSRCRSPKPASRTARLGYRSSSHPPPPLLPKLRDPTPHANVAGPSRVGNSGQSASPVELQAGPHPSDPAPTPVLNTAPVSAPAPAPPGPPPPALTAGSALASSSTLVPALASTYAHPPSASGVPRGKARADVAQPLAALNGSPPPPELNAAPARALSLQPMEGSNFMAMAGVLDFASRAMASAGTLDEVSKQVMQKYEGVQRRLDNLEAREQSVGQHQPSVDEIAQLLARMQKLEQEIIKLREETTKERAEREEEAIRLREEMITTRAERGEEIAQLRKEIVRLREEIKKERDERHYMANGMRKLEEEIQTCMAAHADCVKKEDLPSAVEDAVSSLMLTLRKSTEDMVGKALERQQVLRATTILPMDQRPAVLLPSPSQDGVAGDSRLQLEDSRQGHQPPPGHHQLPPGQHQPLPGQYHPPPGQHHPPPGQYQPPPGQHPYLPGQHQAPPGQHPWHGPDGMYGQQRRGGMPVQPPPMQNGQQFNSSNQCVFNQQRRHNHQGGPPNSGSYPNHSAYRQQNASNQRPYNNNSRNNNPVNNWSGRPQDRQSDRGRYLGEDPFRDGRRHEEPTRDRPRQESLSRDRSVDARSERSPAHLHRDRSRSAARSYRSGDTEQDKTSPIHQFDDSPRDADKTGPSTSIETIEDYTSEKSQWSRSDIHQSSFTQREGNAARASNSCPPSRRSRSRSHSRGRSPSRHRARDPRRSASPRMSGSRHRSSIRSGSHRSHRSPHRSTSRHRSERSQSRHHPRQSYHSRQSQSRDHPRRPQSRHPSPLSNRSNGVAVSKPHTRNRSKPIRQ